MSNQEYNTGQVNPAEIYYRAKAAWMRNEAPKRNITDLFFDIRILLLTLAFLAMGLLSSSHTVEAFSHNAPFALALVSPLAFELYLIASTLTGRTVQRDIGTRLTQVLIFIVAVIANGASGWQQATTTSNASMLTIYQIMSLIAAPIVPLATMSIGHQLALSIQARQTLDKIAEAWKLAEAGVFYRALYTVYNTQGIIPQEARRLAQADAQGYLASGRVSSVRLPATVSTSPTPDSSVDSRQSVDGQDSGQTKDAIVRQWFIDHPEDRAVSVRGVQAKMDAAGIVVGHATIGKVKLALAQLEPTQAMAVVKGDK